MTEEEKIQAPLPLTDQPENTPELSEEQIVEGIVEAAGEPVTEEITVEVIPETAEQQIIEEIKNELAAEPVAEVVIEPEILPEEVIVEEVVTESEPVAEKAEIKEEKTNSDLAEDKAVTANKNFFARPQVRTAGVIIIVLAIIIAVIWLASRSASQDGQADNGVNVRVSDALEKGKVSIIEEVSNEINVNVTSADVPVWPRIKIIAFYNNTVKDPNLRDCSKVELLEREVDKKYDSNIINTVNGLLEPLSATDKAAGYYSAIPLGTQLKYIKLDDDGTLEANFSSQLGKAAGSCAVSAIRSQITNTLMQFAQVQTVKICVDGNCSQDQILQP